MAGTLRSATKCCLNGITRSGKQARRSPAAEQPKAHYQLSLAYARLGEEALSLRHRALYAARLAEVEARMKALRAATGGAPEETTR